MVLISLLLTAALALPAPSAALAEPERSVVARVAGEDRVGTAIAVAQYGWPDGAGRVLLATAATFPDALAAASLAATLDAPILLSPMGYLPDRVLEEFHRLAPDEVVLLGGPAALAPEVASTIDAAGFAYERLGGEDRYGTAARVAGRIEQRGSYVVVSGEAFPDALSAASLLREGASPPTLLLRQASLPAPTAAVLDMFDDDADAVLLGGEAAVSEDVRLALPGTVERIAGATRYGTARAVVARVLADREGERTPLLVASGSDFPDALAVGALAARLDAPLLLVPPGDLGDELEVFLRDHRDRVGDVTVFGGTAAVSERVEQQIGRVLDGLPRDPAPVWLPDVEQARAYAEGRDGSVSFAAIGTDGRLVGYRADTVVEQASVLKVMFMTAYLRQPQVRDRALDAADLNLLGPMIRSSANQPATDIADDLGPGPIEELAVEATMQDFTYTRPWGRSTTSARDQVRFMHALESYLPPRHAGEALGLLAGIVEEQRWGVGAVPTRGWTVHFKGGWGLGTGEVDHQVAKLVHCDGTQVALAVLTTDSPSHDYGKQTLEGVFATLLADLPASSC